MSVVKADQTGGRLIRCSQWIPNAQQHSRLLPPCSTCLTISTNHRPSRSGSVRVARHPSIIVYHTQLLPLRYKPNSRSDPARRVRLLRQCTDPMRCVYTPTLLYPAYSFMEEKMVVEICPETLAETSCGVWEPGNSVHFGRVWNRTAPPAA